MLFPSGSNVPKIERILYHHTEVLRILTHWMLHSSSTPFHIFEYNFIFVTENLQQLENRTKMRQRKILTRVLLAIHTALALKHKLLLTPIKNKVI